MSAHTAPSPASAPMPATTRGAAARSGDSFVRLLDTEVRQTVDSRAGLWLLTVTLGVVVLGAVAVLTLGTPGQASPSEFMLTATFPLLAVALPLIAIMLVTGHPAEPGAPTPGFPVRTLGARALVCGAIAVGIPLLVFALAVLAVLASAASQGVDVAWDVSAGQHLRLGVFAVVAAAAGVVAAVVARGTAAALIGYVALVAGIPLLSGVLAGSHAWFGEIGPWIDLPSAMYQLQGATMSGIEWLHLAAASALWLALPAVVGLRRTARAATAWPRLPHARSCDVGSERATATDALERPPTVELCEQR